MKPGDWLIILMPSSGKVRTLWVEKRTLMILGLGGIFFAGSLAFFGHEYFTFLNERSRLASREQELTQRIDLLEKRLEKAAKGKKTSSKLDLPSLSITGMKFGRRANREGFSVSFQLVNQNPRSHDVSGTLVLVAQNDQPKKPVYQVIPEMELNKGIPQEPEKGKSFRIEKQKFIEAFFDGPSGEVLKTLTIFVYSPEGKLILEKTSSIPAK